MIAATNGRVERLDNFVAVSLFGGDKEAHGLPGLCHEFLVVAGHLVVLIQNGETHDVELDVRIANLHGLKQPAAGNPGPGACGVDPKINLRGHGFYFPCAA